MKNVTGAHSREINPKYDHELHHGQSPASQSQELAAHRRRQPGARYCISQCVASRKDHNDRPWYPTHRGFPAVYSTHLSKAQDDQSVS